MRNQAPLAFPDPVQGVLDAGPDASARGTVRWHAGRWPEAIIGGGCDMRMQSGQLGDGGKSQAWWLIGSVIDEHAEGGHQA